jgi:hypothetical protein
MPTKPSTCTSTYGLIVSETLCNFTGNGICTTTAEAEVVHGSLGGGCGVKGAEDEIGDLLGCFGCAADGGGGRGGGEDGVLGTDYFDRLEAALVEGDVTFGDHGAEAVLLKVSKD